MKISRYAQDQLNNSTSCHKVLLEKDGVKYTGIYNGLNNWGRVETAEGRIHDSLHTEYEDEGDKGYNPSFSPVWFRHYGYTVVEE